MQLLQNMIGNSFFHQVLLIPFVFTRRPKGVIKNLQSVIEIFRYQMYTPI